MPRCASTLTGSLIALTLAASGQAITIRDDVPELDYVARAESPDFDAVGQFYLSVTGNGATAGSGTLISSQWVLTAAHVVEGTDFQGADVNHLRFLIDGQYRYAKQWIPIPEWASVQGELAAGYDLALVQLNTPLTSVTPAPLFEDRLTPGQESVTVGYGLFGNGSQGIDDNSFFGTKRAATNHIDAMGAEDYPFPLGFDLISGWSSRIIATDFDNPANPDDSVTGSSTPLPLEGSIAPGDSGGALFVQTDNGYQLAAVNSFSASIDGNTDSSYGDLSGYTRIWSHLDWIGYTIATESEAPGDYTLDGIINTDDIDFLYAQFRDNPYLTTSNISTIPNLDAIRGTIAHPMYDITGDNKANLADINHLIQNILNTTLGDLNLDGRVDLLDLSILANNFNTNATSWALGDVDGSGTVDLLDLSTLAQHFNATTSIPTPASALLLLPLLTLTSRRA